MSDFRPPSPGFDLKMFFEEPQPFDLMTLLPGAGAVPYLQQGPIGTSQCWGEITQAFGTISSPTPSGSLSRMTRHIRLVSQFEFPASPRAGYRARHFD